MIQWYRRRHHKTVRRTSRDGIQTEVEGGFRKLNSWRCREARRSGQFPDEPVKTKGAEARQNGVGRPTRLVSYYKAIKRELTSRRRPIYEYQYFLVTVENCNGLGGEEAAWPRGEYSPQVSLTFLGEEGGQTEIEGDGFDLSGSGCSQHNLTSSLSEDLSWYTLQKTYILVFFPRKRLPHSLLRLFITKFSTSSKFAKIWKEYLQRFLWVFSPY
jgi:hypothetical protein